MARLVDMFVALAAISTIATFFGFRALARKMVRTLGRKPEGHPHNEHWDELNERRTRGEDPDPDDRR